MILEREIISKKRKKFSSNVFEQIDLYGLLFRAEYILKKKKKILF